MQLVKLLRGGEPVKMSKRSGEFVTLREVVDEVGRDAVRFMMLFRKNDAVLDFDLAKVIEQSKDNAVFYVQYGHAPRPFDLPHGPGGGPRSADGCGRPCRFAGGSSARGTDGFRPNSRYFEKSRYFRRLIEAAGLAHEPHRVAFYLYELASEFHAQWTRGKDLPNLRFIIKDNRELTLARLALVQGVVTVLASGLSMLGVGAPEEMR